MRGLALLLGALADPTRLEMLALLLRSNELCVCDFVGVLGITQSKASRHLRTLWNARLLDDRRSGLWVYYRIAQGLDAERETIVEAVAKVLGERDMSELHGKLTVWIDGKAKATACATPAKSANPAKARRPSRRRTPPETPR